LTLTIAVRPSRTSSPVRLASFSLRMFPVAGELVDQRRQCGPEAFLVGAALVGVDGVREGVHRLGEAGVPLHRDVERQAAVDVLGLGLERHDSAVHRVLAGTEEVDVVDQAAVVLVDDLGLGGLVDLVVLLLLGRRGRSSRRTIVRPRLRNAISRSRLDSVSKL
jgi:hypothetical protein